jgi:aspartate racemase
LRLQRIIQEIGYNLNLSFGINHSVIYHELVLGKILESSREKFIKIIGHLNQIGAEGVVLGCTEIPLLINQRDSLVPIFDTTRIHAEAAVELSLSN